MNLPELMITNTAILSGAIKNTHKSSIRILFTMWIVMILTVRVSAQDLTYNILDYGAIASKSINSQKAIQKAIDVCIKGGGGTVYIPAGEFSSHTLTLGNNVSLYLENGARLYAIPDVTLYSNSKEGAEDSGASFVPALILASKCKNVAIKGNGHIIGEPVHKQRAVTDNDEWPGWNDNARKSGVIMKSIYVDDPKISLVYLKECEQVSISDISIINSPFWSCHIQWSSNVMVTNVTIKSSLEKGVNSDGLDIDGCKNVTISGCIIETGDDAICLKTTRQGGRSESCEYITITDNIVSSTSCGLKLGTESFADFKHVIFANNVVKDSNRGIGIFIRDGATVDDVLFSNISITCSRKPFFWWGDGDAFQLVVLKRNADSKVGTIKNVRLENIVARVQGTSIIRGFEGDNIADILLSNISIDMEAEGQPDKRAEHGLVIGKVKNITVRNVDIQWSDRGEKKWKSALYVNETNGLVIDSFKAQPTSNKIFPVIELVDVNSASITNNIIPPSNQLFCNVKGKQSKNIRFVYNTIELPKETMLFKEEHKNSVTVTPN